MVTQLEAFRHEVQTALYLGRKTSDLAHEQLICAEDEGYSEVAH